MSPDQPTRVEREDGGVELQYPNGARVILMPGFAWAQGAEGALEQMAVANFAGKMAGAAGGIGAAASRFPGDISTGKSTAHAPCQAELQRKNGK